MIPWNLDPELFAFGPFHIRIYGLLFSLAFLGSFFIMVWIFRREKRSEEDLNRLFLSIFLGVLLGARLGHCLFYSPAYYLGNPLEILKVWEGGLASHGAAIGIITALIFYVKRTPGMTFLGISDRVSVVIPLSAMFVRLGNFANSEILGTPTDVPWSVVFLREDMIPRHPVQLYEAISYLTLFFVLVLIYKSGTVLRLPGRLTGIMLSGLFSARFILEFFKEGQAAHDAALPITTGQILSIPLVLFGLYLIIRQPKNK